MPLFCSGLIMAVDSGDNECEGWNVHSVSVNVEREILNFHFPQVENTSSLTPP